MATAIVVLAMTQSLQLNDTSLVDITYTFNDVTVTNSSSINNSFDKPASIIDTAHTINMNITNSNSNSKHTNTLNSYNTKTLPASPIHAIPNTTKCNDKHKDAHILSFNARPQAPSSATCQPEKSEESPSTSDGHKPLHF
jgi:hypothetical protein